MSVLGLHPRVLLALGAIFAILILATLLIAVLRRTRAGADVGELRQRVNSWWIMVAIFTVAIAVNRTISVVFFCLVSLLAFREYLSLVSTRQADRRVLWWAFGAIPFQYYWVWDQWYGMFIIWIPVYIFLFLPVRMIVAGETSGFLRSAGTIHWGLMSTVFSVSHVAFLLVLPSEGNPQGGGPALVLFLVFLTEFNDVAQYIWGKSLGRHKVVERISPKKTVEGLVGGVLTTVALAWLLAPWLTPLKPLESLIAGLMIGLAGFAGDVVISALKRDLGVKDSGTLLPGHGGILDRIDSLTYTAPLFFHVIRYTHF